MTSTIGSNIPELLPNITLRTCLPSASRVSHSPPSLGTCRTCHLYSHLYQEMTGQLTGRAGRSYNGAVRNGGCTMELSGRVVVQWSWQVGVIVGAVIRAVGDGFPAYVIADYQEAISGKQRKPGKLRKTGKAGFSRRGKVVAEDKEIALVEQQRLTGDQELCSYLFFQKSPKTLFPQWPIIPHHSPVNGRPRPD